MNDLSRAAGAAVVGVALGIGLGIGLGWVWHGGSGGSAPEPAVHTAPGPAPVAAAPAPDADALAELRDDLDFERDARAALGEEVEELRDQVAALAETRSPSPAEDGKQDEPAATASRPAADTQPWFDAAELRRSGLSDDRIEQLRARFDDHELDELYLTDTATREGWLRTPRYRQEVRKLNRELRADLGEDDYDWMLFASGKPNRVRVDDVLRDSPGASAGLEPGDLIVRYDGRRVLSAGELRNATTQGEAGQTVVVEVLRNGQTERLYLPRGPIGAKLDAVRSAPQP